MSVSVVPSPSRKEPPAKIVWTYKVPGKKRPVQKHLVSVRGWKDQDVKKAKALYKLRVGKIKLGESTISLDGRIERFIRAAELRRSVIKPLRRKSLLAPILREPVKDYLAKVIKVAQESIALEKKCPLQAWDKYAMQSFITEMKPLYEQYLKAMKLSATAA